jgi:hypothetical protein
VRNVIDRVRIQRDDDVVDAGRLPGDEPAQALHVFYRPRHEKRPVRWQKSYWAS